MKRKGLLVLLGFLVTLFFAACGAEGEPDYIDDPNLEYDEEYGKPMMGLSSEVGKGDSMTGSKTLSVSVDSYNTQVWRVWNAWTDTDTGDARLDGIAWGPTRGLAGRRSTGPGSGRWNRRNPPRATPPTPRST